MKKIFFLLFLSAFSFFCTQSDAGRSDDFGIVMDMSGNVQLIRGENTAPAEIGMNLIRGDAVDMPEGSSVVIVSYSDCNEWQITGPDTVRITDEGLVSKSDKKVPQRQLPVCYSLTEFDSETPDVAGGIILRGIPKDPLAHLREEFKKGEASNSTLITLIMHDLKNSRVEKARPYFEALKARLPDSKIVNALSGKF